MIDAETRVDDGIDAGALFDILERCYRDPDGGAISKKCSETHFSIASSLCIGQVPLRRGTDGSLVKKAKVDSAQPRKLVRQNAHLPWNPARST
ncbi:unnamed protein product [Heligmosomoides polygyrus]|uniref:Transposase n=1 Tax=Heligmosomoides polygyrus TaxID=6339 RepID=A0A183G065_HELPZ|nr:unnamed protein product [Heligmosomoides polygyrus]